MSNGSVIKSNDFTGKRKEALAKQFAAEKAVKDAEVQATLAAEHEEAEATVTDYVVATEVVVGDEVVVERREVEVRINEDVKMLTFGAGNNYDFTRGQRYKVNPDLAAHLEELGLVWH